MIGHRELTAQDYRDIFRRHQWIILTPAIVGLVLALALTLVLPSRWTSSSVILIKHQRVPSDFVRPVVTEGLDSRLATMQEQVLSRTRLEPLIKKYSLFKSYSGSESMEQLVARLRKAINLEPVRPQVTSWSSRQALPGFSVSVTLDDPHKAQQVCAEITSMFIDENLHQREQAAQGTTNFLQSQLNDAKEGLNQQDARLADFKEKYFGMLPDETQTNLNVLGTLNTQLQAVTNQLSQVAQDKTYHESLLDQIMAHNDSSKNPASDLHGQLEASEDKLAALQLRYTSDYPDVVRLKQQIKDLKDRIQQEKGNQLAESHPKASSGASIVPAQVLHLRYQIGVEKESIQQLSREQNRIQKQIKLYESRLQLSPRVEQKYKEITRDHKTALDVYNSLLKKRDESRMATDLERDQQGEQFILIGPANLPQTPSFPKRTKFGGAGLGGGIALGAALAFLLEMRDKVLWNELDVQAVLGTYPVARIPLFEEGKKNRQGVSVVLVPDVSGKQDTVSQE